MISFPSRGVKVLESEQNLQQLVHHLRYHLRYHQDMEMRSKKKKTAPWWSSSRSEMRVLRRLCQPTPTLAGVCEGILILMQDGGVLTTMHGHSWGWVGRWSVDSRLTLARGPLIFTPAWEFSASFPFSFASSHWLRILRRQDVGPSARRSNAVGWRNRCITQLANISVGIVELKNSPKASACSSKAVY